MLQFGIACYNLDLHVTIWDCMFQLGLLVTLWAYMFDFGLAWYSASYKYLTLAKRALHIAYMIQFQTRTNNLQEYYVVKIRTKQ